jgi:hypothetical protein
MQKNSQVVILSGEAASRSEASKRAVAGPLWFSSKPVRGRLLWSDKSPDEIKE